MIHQGEDPLRRVFVYHGDMETFLIRAFIALLVAILAAVIAGATVGYAGLVFTVFFVGGILFLLLTGGIPGRRAR